ncbi:hypothetical protein [Natronobacterium texcoconense]|uniref:hypothetical protein n=1 Tax=Natronobacterium texcoconense TaxID=1095778 RepID=UPI000B89D73A|nr:hypothetical protein [Natronobacterium texcoconense]
MARRYAGDVRWGWTCPRCDSEAPVRKDPSSETFRWECSRDDCPAVGFGFRSRRRARIALRKYCDRYESIYR